MSLTAGRWDQGPPEPYEQPEPGTKGRALPGPVSPPEQPRPVRTWRRRDPGNPSCAQCLNSQTGFCPDHKEFYIEYDPLQGSVR